MSVRASEVGEAVRVRMVCLEERIACSFVCDCVLDVEKGL